MFCVSDIKVIDVQRENRWRGGGLRYFTHEKYIIRAFEIQWKNELKQNSKMYQEEDAPTNPWIPLRVKNTKQKTSETFKKFKIPKKLNEIQYFHSKTSKLRYPMLSLKQKIIPRKFYASANF